MWPIVKRKRNQPHDGPDVEISMWGFYNYCYKYVWGFKKKIVMDMELQKRKGNYKKRTIKNTNISRMKSYRTKK